ncbi:HEAT repeat domain-containing protein [Chryseobacterium geocarposphaerae]|uniref:HEAT repeat protein n=1 Tax=Chryseobacterium geocarposphaerae TaxID=1416776 RepID=A0A2M9C8V1_9FLAO|nr:HEAT repeat domain-containing protein [Chryseobacterium geocarposphaerae]PJJ67267.1 HEAT repeat protein [Chryseobacterium geocarposphaerae]
MKDPLKKYIQDHREEFDTFDVPDEMFEKIMFRLNENPASKGKVIQLFSWRKMFFAASVVIIFSVGSYILWNKERDEKKIIATQEKGKKQEENSVDILKSEKTLKITKIETDKQENENKVFVSNTSYSSKKVRKTKTLIQNNHAENENNFRIRALELLNNQYSASSRLQGIALLKNFPASDQQLVKILSEKALSDENTNVRLAAVETLSEHIQNPEISRKIKQIFLQQDDAMVQKELIAILADQSSSELSTEVNAKLKELASNPTTDDFVKDEAYAVLMKY